MKKLLKRLLGYFLIIETIMGIGMFLFIKEFRQQFVPSILTITIFAFLSYICLKKQKTGNTTHDNSDISITKNVCHYNTSNQHTNEQPVDHTESMINTPVQNRNTLPHTVSSESKSNSSCTPLREEYIESENCIYRADGQTISDDEIPYLIQTGYENVAQQQKNLQNPKFHRTQREEELSFNFIMKYEDDVITYTDKFEGLYHKAMETDDLDTKISLLTNAATAFEKAKKFCYSKGKGGTIFFQNYWEYMHCTANPCLSYLDVINRDLNNAIYCRDIAIPEIINLITENSGILQKNIYELLPDMKKSYIQNIIRKLTAANKIHRIKKGNTYQLFVN